MKEAKVSMATKSTTATKVHESKQFPFQIVEVTTTTEEKEESTFHIGLCGQFVSEQIFADIKSAEKYIAKRPWDIITNMVCITIKNAIDYEKSQSSN